MAYMISGGLKSFLTKNTKITKVFSVIFVFFVRNLVLIALAPHNQEHAQT